MCVDFYYIFNDGYFKKYNFYGGARRKYVNSAQMNLNLMDMRAQIGVRTQPLYCYSCLTCQEQTAY